MKPVFKRNKPETNQTPKKEAGNRPMLLRCVAIFFVFVVGAGGLGFRLSQLQIDEAASWKALASGQQLQNTVITPMRGTIYDSNMNTLAESNVVWTVEAAPDVLAKSRLKDTDEKDPARLVARLFSGIEELGLSEEQLYESLSDSSKQYAPVKKQIDKPYADQIREICRTHNISGIYLRQDTKRYYPYADLAASVLGFVGGDGAGVEGFEARYEEVLAGVPGRLITARNATGGEMAADEDSVLYPAEEGKSVVLTLNADIQLSLEKHLSAAVKQYNAAQRGMGIVMDVNTGAILAMATKPDYDPNQPYYIFDDDIRAAIEAMPENTEEELAAKSQAQGEARMLQWRNKAVSDSYEPGSVFKVITAAAALDSGAATIDSTFNCVGGYHVPGRDTPISCANGAVHGTISLSKALIESCNESFVQIGMRLGAPTWYNYLKGFGLTEPTGVDLPGEPSQGAINTLVYPEEKLGLVELASCSFGQSNKYTALQMITAVAAAVNGGRLLQPHIVDSVLDANGNVVEKVQPRVIRQAISAETSAQLCETLEKLVADTSNSASNAYVAGYHVGGKSGTSEKLDLLGRDENNVKFISSFLGFAPANNPQIAVLIVLDEPEDTTAPGRPTYFGGRLAGPSVGSIIADTVKILGIEPDYGEGEMTRTTVAAPKVTEVDVDQAQVALNNVGLSAQVVGSGTTVVAQSPDVGTQIPRGGTVVLYTDTEAAQQTAVVPELGGMIAGQAIKTLKQLGFNVLTSGAPDDGATVQVISQSHPGGTELPIGTVIELHLQDHSGTTDN